jgi:Glycosyl transferase family 2
MASWGLVVTVKAPEEQVLAFIAHHLALGAAHIWVYFDDPKDTVFERVSRLPKITATRCTDWYWAIRGGRSDLVPDRQLLNARVAQRRCKLDWLGHLDVDEFLYAPRPVSDILAEIPRDVPNVLMDPFEAIHDPDLPDDIFTARQFRGPLHPPLQHLHAAVFGASAHALPFGTLAHWQGKSFCRPSGPGKLGVHNVFVNGAPLLPTPFHPELRVLHFHAQDPVTWRRALAFRLGRGGYRARTHPELNAHLLGASDEVIHGFYDDVMILTPEKAALLEQHDRLITTDLGLRAKVKAMLDGL